MEHSVHDGITISPYPKGLTPPFQKQPPTPHPISENPEPPPSPPPLLHLRTHARACTHTRTLSRQNFQVT